MYCGNKYSNAFFLQKKMFIKKEHTALGAGPPLYPPEGRLVPYAEHELLHGAHGTGRRGQLAERRLGQTIPLLNKYF